MPSFDLDHFDIVCAYIAERYGDSLGPIEECARKYMENLGASRFKFLDYGFYSYDLHGDAIIVLDVYVLPGKRGWFNLKKILGQGEEMAKHYGKRLLIGFSEKCGQNRDLGIRAFQACGFSKAHETEDDEIFWKGM
jgi:hypothetical protein